MDPVLSFKDCTAVIVRLAEARATPKESIVRATPPGITDECEGFDGSTIVSICHEKVYIVL